MRRVVAVMASAVVAVAVMLTPPGAHEPLDPDEPAAADGSLIAGLTRTVYDTEPVLQPQPRKDPDDPDVLAARLRRDQRWVARMRGEAAQAVGPIDWSLCEFDRRQRVVVALRAYYDARTRQTASFAIAGPNARRLIADAWATPTDREIDRFTRAAVEAGFLMPRDIATQRRSALTSVIEGASVRGKTCPDMRVQR